MVIDEAASIYHRIVSYLNSDIKIALLIQTIDKMPQKRKAVIDLSGDSDGEVMGHCSPSKTVKSAVNMSPDSESGNSATSPAGIEDRRFKYSNADTVRVCFFGRSPSD